MVGETPGSPYGERSRPSHGSAHAGGDGCLAGPGSILEAAKRGDEAGFATLYRLLHPPLLRYLRAKGVPEVEDVAGDVWLVVAQRLPCFEGGVDELRALMFTIAARRAADHHRRRFRRAPKLAALASRATTSAPDDPAEQVASAAAASALVTGLTSDQTDVILLRVVAGLPVPEVAAIVGKSEEAVRALQYRAVAQLQRRFRTATKAVTR